MRLGQLSSAAGARGLIEDGYERELSALGLEAGMAVVPLRAVITTVRVRLSSPSAKG